MLKKIITAILIVTSWTASSEQKYWTMPDGGSVYEYEVGASSSTLVTSESSVFLQPNGNIYIYQPPYIFGSLDTNTPSPATTQSSIGGSAYNNINQYVQPPSKPTDLRQNIEEFPAYKYSTNSVCPITKDRMKRILSGEDVFKNDKLVHIDNCNLSPTNTLYSGLNWNTPKNIYLSSSANNSTMFNDKRLFTFNNSIIDGITTPQFAFYGFKGNDFKLKRITSPIIKVSSDGNNNELNVKTKSLLVSSTGTNLVISGYNYLPKDKVEDFTFSGKISNLSFRNINLTSKQFWNFSGSINGIYLTGTNVFKSMNGANAVLPFAYGYKIIGGYIRGNNCAGMPKNICDMSGWGFEFNPLNQNYASMLSGYKKESHVVTIKNKNGSISNKTILSYFNYNTLTGKIAKAGTWDTGGFGTAINKQQPFESVVPLRYECIGMAGVYINGKDVSIYRNNLNIKQKCSKTSTSDLSSKLRSIVK